MSYYYKIEEVRSIIDRNLSWFSILEHFAPELEPALRRPGRHVFCPVHGGKNGDAFRLFKDAHVTGGGICNTCNSKNDGFELLMWIRNWTFAECLREIGDYVGAPQHEILPKPSASGEFVPRKRETAAQTRQFRGKGVIVNFGSAPYEFKKSSSKSYFITLENKDGKERHVWGVDLERAMTASNVGKGDLISLYYLGRKAVTVVEPILDEDGAVVEEHTITTHRNEWEITVQKKAQAPTSEVIEHVQVANGVPEPIESLERNSEALGDSAASQEPRKVVPISDTPAWLIEARKRMERNAARRARDGKRAASKIGALWDECLPLSSSAAAPAFAYFQKRGFAATFQKIAEGDDLRFHPNLPYHVVDEDEKVKKIGEFPAIVASIRDVEGNILTLHRIYLSTRGDKAKVPHPKKMMSVPDDVPVSGGAIQLGDPTESVMGVAEGLETALSAYRATGICTWATVSAQMMKTVQLPDHIHTVIAWADLDKSRAGEKAAASLKERLQAQGVRVIVVTPQCGIPKRAKGVDWNDVLLEKGILGFPNPIRLREFLGLEAMNASPLRKAFG